MIEKEICYSSWYEINHPTPITGISDSIGIQNYISLWAKKIKDCDANCRKSKDKEIAKKVE